MRLKLSLLLVFIITYSWSQSGSTKTFTGNGTFSVPAGVTSLNVQALGGGGSGGGASGAPLLLGRGAAGGGGGAYASNTLLVTPGATLNVVVASQTSGTNSVGVAGGNSTISGFESSILAAGGSGGDANNAGGSPTGGIGGTIAASAGSIKFAGANGGNGNSWNLLGLLLSSGAGGAGGGSGGAGGTAVSGLILSNAPGNAGSPPGGAGSGAINSALGASQIGGAGAAGRVVIAYSCSNFSLTNTTATSICASAGSTSTVTLTGSAASLPIGNYVVTYDRSSPNATTLTANLVVSTAGTGTFTATGLTAAGSSTITITNLTSESCSSNITTNNTATVIVSLASVGGTVTGGTTINVGSTSGLLTLSGHTGTVVKWQSAVSPFTTWIDIANINTTYTSSPLTETTQFRAVVQSGSCPAANSAATTVTVNPRPTVALAASATTVCFSAGIQTTGLSYTTLTGDPTTYSIVWDTSPANSFAPVTNAPIPASPFTIVIPAGTVGGTYSGTLTVKDSNGSVSSPGSPFTVTVKPLPTINTTFVSGSVCSGATEATPISLFYNGLSGSPTTYSIVWDTSSPSNNLTNVTDAALPASPLTIVFPAGTAAGEYSGVVTVKNGNGCVSSGSPFTIEVGETPTIAITQSEFNICAANFNFISTINIPYSGTTGSPDTYSIVWNPSPSNNLPEITDEDLSESPISFSIRGLDAGTYTGILTVSNGSCISSDSVITINVAPKPTITTTGTINTVCSSNTAQNATLAYSASTNNPVSYSIDWDDNNFADQGNTSFTFASGGGIINNIDVPANVPVGNYSGTIYISDGNCENFLPVSITINEPPSVTFTDPTTLDICFGDTIGGNLLNYDQVKGTPTTYSLIWNSSPTNNLESVIDEEFPTDSFIYLIPSGIAAGTYIGFLTVKNEAGCESSPIAITINVNESPTITTTGTIDEVHTSSSPQNAALTYAATTNDPIKYTIIWDSTIPDEVNTSFVFSPSGGVINTIRIPANVPGGTYTGLLFISNGTCSGSQPISITITDPAPTITLASSTEDICPDISAFLNSTPLSYSATTGSPITYSIVWDASSANILAGVTDAPLQESPILVYIQGNTPAGTYTGTLTVKNADSVVSSGNIFTLTVNQKPTLTSTGVINSVCSSNNPQVAFFQYTASSGSATSYSIDWDQTANDALLEDKPTTSFTFAASGGSMIINIAANVLPGTYSGTLVVNNTSCSTSYPISITITTGLVGGTVTGGTTITSGSTSGLLTLSGTTAFVTRWQSSVSPFTVWSNIVNTSTTYTSGPLTETTQFRAVVQRGTCFAVNSDPTTVTVLSAFAKSTDTDSAEKITSVTTFNQVINVETINQTINQVFVFDVSGNLIYKKKGVSDSKLVINTLRSSNQVLIVKVVLNDNRIATKKVIY